MGAFLFCGGGEGGEDGGNGGREGRGRMGRVMGREGGEGDGEGMRADIVGMLQIPRKSHEENDRRAG